MMNRCRNCFFAIQCGELTSVIQCFISREIHSTDCGSGCNAFIPDSFSREKMKLSMRHRIAQYNRWKVIQELLRDLE